MATSPWLKEIGIFDPPNKHDEQNSVKVLIKNIESAPINYQMEYSKYAKTNLKIGLHVLNFEHSNFDIVSNFEFSISDFIINLVCPKHTSLKL